MKCQPVIQLFDRDNDERLVIFRVGGLMLTLWNRRHIKNHYGKLVWPKVGSVRYVQLYRLELVFSTI